MYEAKENCEGILKTSFITFLVKLRDKNLKIYKEVDGGRKVFTDKPQRRRVRNVKKVKRLNLDVSVPWGKQLLRRPCAQSTGTATAAAGQDRESGGVGDH